MTAGNRLAVTAGCRRGLKGGDDGLQAGGDGGQTNCGQRCTDEDSWTNICDDECLAIRIFSHAKNGLISTFIIL